MLKRRHRKQMKLAQQPNFLKTIEKNEEKVMTEVTYSGGQRGKTAISDIGIQGLDVWQNRQLSNKATWQQLVICEYTRSNPHCPAELSAVPYFSPRPSTKSVRKPGAWMDARECLFSVFHTCATKHRCDCTNTKPVRFDTTPACFSFFMPFCSSWC